MAGLGEVERWASGIFEERFSCGFIYLVDIIEVLYFIMKALYFEMIDFETR